MNLKLSLFALVLLAGFAFAQEADTNPTSTEATTPAGGDSSSSAPTAEGDASSTEAGASTEATTPDAAGGEASSSAPVEGESTTAGGEASTEVTTPAGAGGEAPTEAATQAGPNDSAAPVAPSPAVPGVVGAGVQPGGVGTVAGSPLGQAKAVLDWFAAILNAIRCITPSQCLFDVSAGDTVKGKLQACNAFIEQYAEKAVAPNKVDETVKSTFESPKNAKIVRAADKTILATTFRCCHVINQKEYLKETKSTGAYATPQLAKGQTCEKVIDSLLKVMIQKSGKKQ